MMMMMMSSSCCIYILGSPKRLHGNDWSAESTHALESLPTKILSLFIIHAFTLWCREGNSLSFTRTSISIAVVFVFISYSQHTTHRQAFVFSRLSWSGPIILLVMWGHLEKQYRYSNVLYTNIFKRYLRKARYN